MFQTLVDAFRLYETKAIFHNYSENQEFSLKHWERINLVTNGTVWVYVGEPAQEMTQGKSRRQYLGNTGNKAELIDWFKQYIQQDQVCSKLKGILILNSRTVTYRINISDLKASLTSNDVEVDLEIVYCCSRFNKPCIVKTKDINILILMIYSYVVQQPEHDWLMKTDKDSFISIRKLNTNGKIQSEVVIRLVTSLMFQTE